MSKSSTRQRFLLRLSTCALLALGCAQLSACGPAAAAVIVMEEQSGKKKKKKGSADETSSRSARLSWSPPTHRENGQPLGSDLAGYKVYRGSSSRTYDTVVDLNDPLMTQHAFDRLPPGRYYFAVSAYDTNGLESGYSSEVDKLVE